MIQPPPNVDPLMAGLIKGVVIGAACLLIRLIWVLIRSFKK
jgi:hypothetical protein